MNYRPLMCILLFSLILVGCFDEQSKESSFEVSPKIFFGNQLRMDVDGNGYTIDNVILGSGVSGPWTEQRYVASNELGMVIGTLTVPKLNVGTGIQLEMVSTGGRIRISNQGNYAYMDVLSYLKFYGKPVWIDQDLYLKGSMANNLDMGEHFITNVSVISGTSGGILIKTEDSETLDPGSINIIGGNATASGTSGASITIQAGDGLLGSADPGTVHIVAGDNGGGVIDIDGETTFNSKEIADFKVNVRRNTSSSSVGTSGSVDLYDTDGGVLIANIFGEQGMTHKIVNCGSSGNLLTIHPDAGEMLYGVLNGDITLSDGQSITLHYDTTEGWW